MKPFFVPIFIVVFAFLAPAQAQEKAKTDKKTLVFPAGTKSPEAAATIEPKMPEKDPVPAPEKQVDKPAIITSTVPPGPAQIVRAFFLLIQQGDIDGAYAGLTKGSKIAERPEELRTLKAKTKEAVEVFGVVHGYDLVDSKPVGERLVRATYVSLGHEYPLRWRFYFYRSEEVWKLIDMRVDDKLTGVFDEPEEVKVPDLKP